MKAKLFLNLLLDFFLHLLAPSLLLLLLFAALLIQALTHIQLRLPLALVLRRAHLLLLLSQHLLHHLLLFKLSCLVDPVFFEVLLVETEVDGLVGLGGLGTALEGEFPRFVVDRGDGLDVRELVTLFDRRMHWRLWRDLSTLLIQSASIR